MPLLVVSSVLACGTPQALPPTAPSEITLERSSYPTDPPPLDDDALPREGDVRCGIDDEPAPSGEHRSPRRERTSGLVQALLGFDPDADSAPNGRRSPISEVRIARHRAQTSWTLGATVNAPSAFHTRIEACGAEVDGTDGGQHAFTLQFATSGVPLWVRATGSKASTFSDCLARAACLLEEGHAPVGRTQTALFEVRTEAPVFRGSVSVQLLQPVRPPPQAHARATISLKKGATDEPTRRAAEQVALGCAAARPPAEGFTFDLTLSGLDPESRPDVPPADAPAPSYPTYMARCLRDGLPGNLRTTSPASTRPTKRSTPLNLALRIRYLRDAPGQL